MLVDWRYKDLLYCEQFELLLELVAFEHHFKTKIFDG